MKNIAWFILLFVLAGCAGTGGDKKILKALSMAGDNKEELFAVLKHYADDSLKLRAACFLIENMPYHAGSEEFLVSPDGVAYHPDITLFDSSEAAAEYCDSLLASGWKIQRSVLYDIQHVKADFLIQNIELAFEVWKKPWSEPVGFEDFCRYILPYRAQHEAVSGLRKELMERYIPLLDSLNPKNAFEACMIINKELGKFIRYKETGNPLQATVAEIHHTGTGTCEALCNYATLVMRSVGIPIAIYNTIWTRMDGGHSWCAVLSGSKFYDFNPGEVHPDAYQDKLAVMWYLQPAKVYQMHFAPYGSESLAGDDGYVTWLKSSLAEDVTVREKNPTYTLAVLVGKARSSRSSQVYLCAYNRLRWTPIAIGRRDGDSCVFKDVSGKHFFLIAEAVEKDKLRYITAPFLTERDGRWRMLVPDKERIESCSFRKENGKHGTLYYWNTEVEDFVPLTFKSESDSMQCYDNIPADALLKYVSGDENEEQKLGIMLDDEYKKSGDL